MSYFLSKQLSCGFDEAIETVQAQLAEEGFGVLTEIDVRETLRKKLDVDFRKYRILGACNPPYAYRALQLESQIGLLLPCNVVVQETDPGAIEVSAVDPAIMMQAVDNPALAEVAREIRDKLELCLSRL